MSFLILVHASRYPNVRNLLLTTMRQPPSHVGTDLMYKQIYRSLYGKERPTYFVTDAPWLMGFTDILGCLYSNVHCPRHSFTMEQAWSVSAAPKEDPYGISVGWDALSAVQFSTLMLT